MSKSKVLVLIPAWNEQESIVKVVNSIKSIDKSYGILVIDDGSEDETASYARNAGAIVISLPYNLGVGGALRTGFKYAIKNNYSVAVQVDGDGQHDPVFIPELIKALNNSDIVIGARFAGKGNYKVSGPRKWVMQGLSYVMSKMAHTKLTDTTSGFKALNKKSLTLFSENYPVEYLGDTIEALVIALQSGLTISQVPVEMKIRQGGTASANPVKSGIYLIRVCFALIFALSKPSKTSHK